MSEPSADWGSSVLRHRMPKLQVFLSLSLVEDDLEKKPMS